MTEEGENMGVDMDVLRCAIQGGGPFALGCFTYLYQAGHTIQFISTSDSNLAEMGREYHISCDNLIEVTEEGAVFLDILFVFDDNPPALGNIKIILPCVDTQVVNWYCYYDNRFFCMEQCSQSFDVSNTGNIFKCCETVFLKSVKDLVVNFSRGLGDDLRLEAIQEYSSVGRNFFLEKSLLYDTDFFGLYKKVKFIAHKIECLVRKQRRAWEVI